MPVQFFSPLTFGLLAVVAIGTIIYTLYNGEQQQQIGYHGYDDRRRRRPSNRQIYLRNERANSSNKSDTNSNYSRASSWENLSNGDSINCIICLDDLENPYKPVRTLNCGHKYHIRCINKWFSQEPTCPICRASGL